MFAFLEHLCYYIFDKNIGGVLCRPGNGFFPV